MFIMLISSLERMLILRRDDKVQILGERLRILREEAGFSQNKLAKLIGIQQSSLNRYESGFSNPPPRRCSGSQTISMCPWIVSTVAQTSSQGKTYKYKPRLDLGTWRSLWKCASSRARELTRNCDAKASILKMVSEDINEGCDLCPLLLRQPAGKRV